MIPASKACEITLDMQSVVRFALPRHEFLPFASSKIFEHRHSESVPNIIPVLIRHKVRFDSPRKPRWGTQGSNTADRSREWSQSAPRLGLHSQAEAVSTASVAIVMGPMGAKWGENTAIDGQFGNWIRKRLPCDHGDEGTARVRKDVNIRLTF